MSEANAAILEAGIYESRSPAPPPPSPEGTQRESRLQDVIEIPTENHETVEFNPGQAMNSEETRDSTAQTDDQDKEETNPKDIIQSETKEEIPDSSETEPASELNENLKAVYLSLHPEEGDAYSRMPEVDGMDLER